MKEKTASIKPLNSVYQYFIPYPPVHNLLADTGSDETTAELGFNYDYETVSKSQWKVHIDISLAVHPIAQICNRCTFLVKGSDEEVFGVVSFTTMLKPAVERCLETFGVLGKTHQLEEVELDAAFFSSGYQSMAENASMQYVEYRKPDDVANQNMQEESIHFTTGRHSILCVLVTFMVLDELMFLNPEFDLEHNRKEIETLMPISRYYTLKMNSLKISKEDVSYTLYQSVMFLLYLDLSLQMLVGDRADMLMEALKPKGVGPEELKDFFAFSTGLLADMKQNLSDSGATIGNLEVEYDWNTLLR